MIYLAHRLQQGHTVAGQAARSRVFAQEKAEMQAEEKQAKQNSNCNETDEMSDTPEPGSMGVSEEDEESEAESDVEMTSAELDLQGFRVKDKVKVCWHGEYFTGEIHKINKDSQECEVYYSDTDEVSWHGIEELENADWSDEDVPLKKKQKLD